MANDHVLLISEDLCSVPISVPISVLILNIAYIAYMSDLEPVPGSRYVASLLQSEPWQFNLFLATPSENQGVCLESCRENITNFISPPSQQPTQLWYAAALLLAALRIAKIPAEHRRPRPHFGLHLLNLFQSSKIFSDNLGRTRGQGPLSPFSRIASDCTQTAARTACFLSCHGYDGRDGRGGWHSTLNTRCSSQSDLNPS